MRMNKVIENLNVWWYDLGESDDTPNNDWANMFQLLFWSLGAEAHHVQSVINALHECWHKMVSGEADVPKEWAKTKQPFQDASAVLSAIVTGTASESQEAASMKEFALANLDTLRKVGHGAAMKTWVAQLPEDRSVNPKDPKHIGLALGFGIVLMPCAIVELSENSQGGLTRIALPFLSMSNAWDSVEPMLNALGVVVWHLAEALFPMKIAGCQLTTHFHMMEIKKDHGALWFNKACGSSRLATCIFDPNLRGSKRKQWYAYLGGGAIDVEQSELLAGAVVLCKDWVWAELALLAAWLLLCTCPCGPPDDLLCDPWLIFTAHDDDGGEGGREPTAGRRGGGEEDGRAVARHRVFAARRRGGRHARRPSEAVRGRREGADDERARGRRLVSCRSRSAAVRPQMRGRASSLPPGAARSWRPELHRRDEPAPHSSRRRRAGSRGRGGRRRPG